jgi:hypothetical protein
VKIGHLNVRDLLSKNKKDDLSCLLHAHNFDLLAISETWLYPDILTSEIDIPGYTVVRKDRKFVSYRKRGGGICVYVNNNWRFTDFPDFQTPEPIESLKITVARDFQAPLTIIVMYRPTTILSREFKVIDDILSAHNTDTFFLGDLNLEFGHPVSPECRSFKSSLYRFGFEQLITDPTHHYTSHNVPKASIIDFVISNINPRSLNCGVLPCSLSPDHDLTFAVIHRSKLRDPARVVKSRSLDLTNTELLSAIGNLLSIAPWWILDICPTVNELFRVFHFTVLHVLDSTAPIKSVLVKSRLPKWLTPDFKRLLHLRDNLKKHYNALRTPESWDLYRKARNLAIKLKKELKRAGVRAEVERVSRSVHKSKAHWKIFNEISGRSKQKIVIPSLVKHGRCITDQKMICEELCLEFSDQQNPWKREIHFGEYLPKHGRDFKDTLSYINLSAGEVDSGLRGINANKPPGEDGISARFWKLFSRTLAPLILRIFNASLFHGTFPDCFKDCFVLPLYKGKGARTDTKAYRPISILSPLSKMMERLVHRRITLFLQRWNLLSPCQHGFRNSHSTDSATIKFTNDCFLAGDRRLMTGAVFLDYRSAFPSVPHSALSYKLLRYGIRGRIHKWLCSYLENRPMKVKIGDTCSEPVMVECGVPQGSVLGPLLFSLFINDLPKCVSRCKVILYADDVILYYAGSSKDDIQRVLQDDLNRIADWSNLNGLTISVVKTKSMLIYPSRAENPGTLEVSSNAEPIEAVNTFKYLGLWVDPQLKWNHHCDTVFKRMNARLKLIQRHKHSVNRRYLKIYCDSLVLSVLNFLLPVWGSISSSRLEQFDVLQLRMLNRMLSTQRSRPTPRRLTSEFQELGWLTTSERRDESMLKFLFKHGICRSPLSDTVREMFHFRPDNSDRTTRKPRNLVVPINRTAFGDRGFAYRTAVRWNQLPAALQNQTNYTDFCEELRKFIIVSRPANFLHKFT